MTRGKKVDIALEYQLIDKGGMARLRRRHG